MGYEGDKWESSIVAELDDALSKWEHSVPAFCAFLYIFI